MDYREYHRNYYQKRRGAFIAYLGGRCAECSSVDSLEIDHIDASKKTMNISSNLTLSNPAVIQELNNCQLLCADCHKIKSTQQKLDKGFKHGTVYSFMRKKCRCDQCEKFKRQWYDARNQKRNAPS